MEAGGLEPVLGPADVSDAAIHRHHAASSHAVEVVDQVELPLDVGGLSGGVALMSPGEPSGSLPFR